MAAAGGAAPAVPSPHLHHHRAKHTPPRRPEGEIATPFCLHAGPCHVNAWKGFSRTFMWGYGVKGGIALLLSVLFKNNLLRPSRWKKAIIASFGKDTLKFGLFLASLIGSYKTVLCLMRWIRGKEDRMNAVIAGAASGASMLIDQGERRKEIALYLFARSLQLNWHSLVRRGYLPNIPYGDTILFMLFCAYVQYSFFYEPALFEPGYYKFVRRFGRHATVRIFSIIFSAMLLSWHCKMDRFLEFWREGNTPPPMQDKTMHFWSEIKEAL